MRDQQRTDGLREMKSVTEVHEDFVSLKQFLQSEIATIMRVIDERDRLYNTQFKASEVAVNAALAAQEKAVTAAFSASEKAIVKAEDAQKEYNMRSNEFRGQLDDQAKMLMPRLETASLFKAYDDKVSFVQANLEAKMDAQRINSEKVFETVAKDLASLRESRSEGTGKGTGYHDVWVIIVAVISLLIGLSRFLPIRVFDIFGHIASNFLA